MEILKKLGTIQTKLKAPKKQYNKFGEYNYRNVEDIQEAVKPFLEETGTVLILGDEVVQIGDRFYIKATARLYLSDNPEEFVKNTAFARETEHKTKMDDAQVTGAASSYARKYALGGLFLLDDTKDFDSMDNSADTKKSKKTEAPKMITKKMQETIISEIKRTGVSLNSMLKNYGVQTLDMLTEAQGADAIANLSVRPPKRAHSEHKNEGFA